MFYACPKCQQPLIKKETQYVCRHQHHFDIAKKGYVNLLLNPQKPSNHPGDAIESLKARQRFLNTGSYDIIIQTILNIIQAKQPSTLLDVGCGEGYYPSFIQKKRPHLTISAFDISKEAIQEATKYKNQIHWFVANATNIPILSQSQSMALCMFSFFQEKEIARVLEDQGLFILVQAGPEHLIEMKKLMYNDVFQKTWEAQRLDFLTYLETINIHSMLHLDASSFLDLAMMTPHYYRMPKEKRETLTQTQSYDVTIDVNISIYQKTSK